jgi:hypothetical protein
MTTRSTSHSATAETMPAAKARAPRSKAATAMRCPAFAAAASAAPSGMSLAQP